MDSSIPAKVGRYEVNRLLGSGAMGHVFLGRDPELDRPVAIKTVKELNLSPDVMVMFLERFRNEARAAARLRHESIVQVYDVGEQEGVGPYMVCEYVPGASLKGHLKTNGPMSPEAAVEFAKKIGSAVDEAHAAGIIHRDIKPDNILIAVDGTPKLADFGVAKIPNAALTKEGQFLGTPCYSAPETLKTATYSNASDVFSLAAVLYEVVSASRAFPGDDAVSVANRVIHGEPVPPSEVAKDNVVVPKAVDEVILAGLSKDPTQRYESASALAKAFGRAFQRSGMFSTQEDDEDEGSSKWMTILVIASVVIGALGIGIALMLAFDEASPGGDPDPAPDAGTETQDARVDTIRVIPFPDTGSTTPYTPTFEDSAPPPVVDATPEATVDTASAEDAATDAGEADTGSTAPAPGGLSDEELAAMNSHDREEAAKDAIDSAKAAIRRQDMERARQLLERAQRLDPSNGDVTGLLQQLTTP